MRKKSYRGWYRSDTCESRKEGWQDRNSSTSAMQFWESFDQTNGMSLSKGCLLEKGVLCQSRWPDLATFNHWLEAGLGIMALAWMLWQIQSCGSYRLSPQQGLLKGSLISVPPWLPQSRSPIDWTSWESLKFTYSAYHCYRLLP